MKIDQKKTREQIKTQTRTFYIYSMFYLRLHRVKRRTVDNSFERGKSETERESSFVSF